MVVCKEFKGSHLCDGKTFNHTENIQLYCKFTITPQIQGLNQPRYLKMQRAFYFSSTSSYALSDSNYSTLESKCDPPASLPHQHTQRQGQAGYGTSQIGGER